MKTKFLNTFMQTSLGNFPKNMIFPLKVLSTVQEGFTSRCPLLSSPHLFLKTSSKSVLKICDCVKSKLLTIATETHLGYQDQKNLEFYYK